MPSATNLDTGGGRVPLLPGLPESHLVRRSAFPKRQLLQWHNGVAVMREEGTPGDRLRPPVFMGDLAVLQSAALQLQLGDRLARSKSAPVFTPPWVIKEKQILRFQGYFQQYLSLEKEVMQDTSVSLPPNRSASVALPSRDEYCVRYVVLRYFMSDHTIELLEPRVPNSGLQQGVLLSRQPVPHNAYPNRCYNFTDLTLGTTLNLYGRNVTLADCDPQTRDLLESEGVDVGEAIAVPADPYLTRRQARAPSARREAHLSGDNLEARPSAANPTGPLLRFSGVVQEADEGAVQCVVLYDVTTRLMEVRRTNRQPGTSAVVLKWCSPTVRRPTGPAGGAAEDVVMRAVSPEDLAPPASLHVFGRRLVISDCDDYTKSYLQKWALAGNSGSIQHRSPDAAVDAEKLDPATVALGPAATDAAAPDVAANEGAPLRSALGSQVAAVQPTTAARVRTDITGRRVIRSGLLPPHATEVLRFSAKLRSQLPSDKERQFVLSFFPSDETLELSEIHGVGGLGGKVAARARLLKPAPPGEPQRHYELSDFAIGNAVTVYGREFVVTGCDRRVLNVALRSPEAVTSAFRESVRTLFGETDAHNVCEDQGK